MKKIAALALSLTLTGVLLLSASAAGNTAGRLPIEVDGQATAVEGCVMVPLRAMAEELGYTVQWEDGVIRVDTGAMHTDVMLGVDRYVLTTSNPDLVGMSAPFSLGCPSYAVDGTTYVPLSLFEALLGTGNGSVTLDGSHIAITTGAN